MIERRYQFVRILNHDSHIRAMPAENFMILQFFVPLFWAILITLLITPISIKVAERFKLIDYPNSAPHKVHHNSVPKGGGIAIAVVVFFLALTSGKLEVADIRAILAAAVFILLFGIGDDAKGLSAGWKLTGQVLAAVVLIWQGIYIRMFGHPFPNIAMTIFWIVGITNAFNLVDSMDGLALGLAAIASTFFLFVTIDANQLQLTYMSAILLGSCIGLFYFNTPPAGTFLGDSGAQFLGFMLATLAMAYTPPGLPQPSSWFVPILLLGVPIFDTTLVVISRLRRGVPIYKAGQDHVYHRLTQLGMSPAQAVMTMHVAALLIGCLAFVALPLPPLEANLLFGLSLLSGLVGLVILQKKD
jgi:UDP-GlcNAc:undecaprenyl-phosphate/decaprenyl-phosphate GlcNAc-1-phosphate transferase